MEYFEFIENRKKAPAPEIQSVRKHAEDFQRYDIFSMFSVRTNMFVIHACHFLTNQRRRRSNS